MIAHLLSLYRVPAGVALWYVPADGPWRGMLLLSALFSDVIDGWWARRSGGGTRFGALLDPIADKLFAAAVVYLALQEGGLTMGELLLLSLREGALFLYVVTWLVLSCLRPVRLRFGSVWSSKVFTTCQFCVLAARLLGYAEPAWLWALFPLFASTALVEWIWELRPVDAAPSGIQLELSPGTRRR